MNNPCCTTFSQDEPIHDHEAAGGRHLWECAYGQEQRVWGAGGHQEVRAHGTAEFPSKCWVFVSLCLPKNLEHQGEGFSSDPKVV